MSFANYIDRNVMRMAGFIVWVSRNPAGAARIVKDTIGVKLKVPVTTSEKVEKYERSLEEERRKYPGELPRLTLGASLLLILLFFAIYLIFYLLGVH